MKQNPETADKIVCWAMAFAGLVFIGIAIPMVLEAIAPNSLYGFRTEKTLSDPAIWYAANVVGGWDLIVAGAVIFLASLYFLFVGRKKVKPGWTAWILLIIFVVALVGAVGHSLYYLYYVL